MEVPHQTHSSVVRYVGLFAALLVGFAALMKLRGSGNVEYRAVGTAHFVTIVDTICCLIPVEAL